MVFSNCGTPWHDRCVIGDFLSLFAINEIGSTTVNGNVFGHGGKSERKIKQLRLRNWNYGNMLPFIHDLK